MKIITSYKWEVIYQMEKEIFVSDSYSDLVEQMRMIVYSQPQTNEEHRLQTQERFYNWDKTVLDVSSDEAFVKSLIKNKYVKVLGASRKPLKSQ